MSVNNYDKILNYSRENNGYITTKGLKSLNINRTFLSKLVNNGKLERVGTGVYKLPEYPIDNFYILSQCSKNMCFSYATSLYLHNMSDRIPLIYDITVPYNYSGSLLKSKNALLRYVDDDIFELGIANINTVNNLTVQCYDLERTICDIIKDKNRMDKEIYAKALKEYARSKNKNILKLIKYAKKMNIEEEVVQLMEVLL